MTGEQSVLVFGVLCVVLFIVLLSRSGKKQNANHAEATANPATRGSKPKQRSQRRKK
jgi:hypothetical protein